MASNCDGVLVSALSSGHWRSCSAWPGSTAGSAGRRCSGTAKYSASSEMRWVAAVPISPIARCQSGRSSAATKAASGSEAGNSSQPLPGSTRTRSCACCSTTASVPNSPRQWRSNSASSAAGACCGEDSSRRNCSLSSRTVAPCLSHAPATGVRETTSTRTGWPCKACHAARPSALSRPSTTTSAACLGHSPSCTSMRSASSSEQASFRRVVCSRSRPAVATRMVWMGVVMIWRLAAHRGSNACRRAPAGQ